MAFEIFLGGLNVKVTLEGHINKLFPAITPTFMHGFQNNSAQVFSLTSSSAIRNICLGMLTVKVTLEGQMIKWS